MSKQANPYREKKLALEGCIQHLFKSLSLIDKQVGIWKDIIDCDQETDGMREKIRVWESVEQEKMTCMGDIKKYIKDFGQSPKYPVHYHPDSDLMSDFEKKKAIEERNIKENNLQSLFIKPSKVISIYLNPYMKEAVLMSKLRHLISQNHQDYSAYVPKEKQGETSKLYTVLHIPTFTVCNMLFEVIPTKTSGPVETPFNSTLVLTDLSFHMLLEPLASNFTAQRLDPDFVNSNYITMKKSSPIGDILQKTLGSREFNIEFRQTSSTLDMYNVMSKLVRNKYRTAGSTGTTSPSTMMERVLDLIDRYMKFLPKMTCKSCKQGIVYNPKTGTFVYPFLNYGDTFMHETCTTERNIGLFV